MNYFKTICNYFSKEENDFKVIILNLIGSIVIVYLFWYFDEQFTQNIIINKIIGNPIVILLYLVLSFLLIILNDKQIITNIKCIVFLRKHFLTMPSKLLGGFIATIFYSEQLNIEYIINILSQILQIVLLLYYFAWILSKSIHRITSEQKVL